MPNTDREQPLPPVPRRRLPTSTLIIAILFFTLLGWVLHTTVEHHITTRRPISALGIDGRSLLQDRNPWTQPFVTRKGFHLKGSRHLEFDRKGEGLLVTYELSARSWLTVFGGNPLEAGIGLRISDDPTRPSGWIQYDATGTIAHRFAPLPDLAQCARPARPQTIQLRLFDDAGTQRIELQCNGTSISQLRLSLPADRWWLTTSFRDTYIREVTLLDADATPIESWRPAKSPLAWLTLLATLLAGALVIAAAYRSRMLSSILSDLTYPLFIALFPLLGMVVRLGVLLPVFFLPLIFFALLIALLRRIPVHLAEAPRKGSRRLLYAGLSLICTIWLIRAATDLPREYASALDNSRPSVLAPEQVWDGNGTLRLDPAKYRFVGGQRIERGELQCDLTLDEGAILEIQVNKSGCHNGVCETWEGLLVSASPHLPSSWFRAQNNDIELTHQIPVKLREGKLRLQIDSAQLGAGIGGSPATTATGTHLAGGYLALATWGGAARLQNCQTALLTDATPIDRIVRRLRLALPWIPFLIALIALSLTAGRAGDTLLLVIPPAIATLALVLLATGHWPITFDPNWGMRFSLLFAYGWCILLLLHRFVPRTARVRNLLWLVFAASLFLALLRFFDMPGALLRMRSFRTPHVYWMSMLDTAFRIGNPYHRNHSFRFRYLDWKPEPMARRAILMGGSAAFGEGLPNQPDQPDIAHELERHAKRHGRELAVINAAAKGYTLARIRRFYQRNLASFEPDVMVLYISFNDTFNVFSERMFLQSRQSHPEQTIEFSTLFRNLIHQPPAPAHSLDVEFELELTDFVRELQSEGIEVILVPEIVSDPLLHDGAAATPIRRMWEAMRRVAEEQNATLVDLPTIQAQHDANNLPLFIDRVHLTPLGNRWVAQQIAQNATSALYGFQRIDTPRHP